MKRTADIIEKECQKYVKEIEKRHHREIFYKDQEIQNLRDRIYELEQKTLYRYFSNPHVIN